MLILQPLFTLVNERVNQRGDPEPARLCCSPNAHDTTLEVDGTTRDLDDTFDAKSKKWACCGGEKNDRDVTACCGGGEIFDTTVKACCGRKTYDPKVEACCGENTYDPEVDACCHGDIITPIAALTADAGGGLPGSDGIGPPAIGDGSSPPAKPNRPQKPAKGPHYTC